MAAGKGQGMGQGSHGGLFGCSLSPNTNHGKAAAFGERVLIEQGPYQAMAQGQMMSQSIFKQGPRANNAQDSVRI